jgi:hypothetical protein
MKRILLLSFLSMAGYSLHSQCVLTCSNYVAQSITYSTFPTGVSVTTFTGYNGVSNLDDGDSGPIPIGFNFSFYCNSYSSVIICSNGFIQFNYAPLTWSGPVVHPTQSIPNSQIPNGMVSFNMTDLDLTPGGSVSYTTIGTAPNRQFIVTYSNVPCFTTNTDLNTGQIVLYETSNLIEIHTTIAKGDQNQSYKGTQGIENTTGTVGTAATGRNDNATWHSSAGNTAFRFVPAYAPTPPSGLLGDTLLCQGEIGNYLINTSPGATLYTWTGPGSSVGGSTTTAASFTAGSSGNVSVTASYSCGTSTPVSLSVTVIPAPNISILSATPGLMCSGVTVTFSFGGAATYTLQPGNIIGSSPLTDIPLTTTVYSVSGTATTGCNSIYSPSVTITVNETPTVIVSSGAICIGQTYTINATGANSYNYSSLFPNVTPTTTGVHTYTVVGTATNGCVSQAAISSVTVNALPSVSVVATRTTICKNETTSLTASGASSYAWSVNSSTAPSLTVSPAFNTSYSVTGTDANGCKKTVNITVNVSTCNGIGESGQERLITFYPNPTSGQLNINASQDVSIVIFDLTGRQIHAQKLDRGTHQVNLENYPRGQYFIRVENGEAQQHFTIVRD